MLVLKQEHSLKTIEYYLDRAIPKGSHVRAINPGPILTQLLPNIAKQKNCTISIQNANTQILKQAIRLGIYSEQNPDLTIIELDHITPQGGLIKPTKLPNTPLIGVASVLSWKTKAPETHDFIKTQKTITELGINTPEHLEQELISYAS